MAAEYRKAVPTQQADLPVPKTNKGNEPQTPLPDVDSSSAPPSGTAFPVTEHRVPWIQDSHMWIKASLPEEGPCLLTGICFIGDDIIVCDNENKTIKRFHMDGKFVEEMFLNDPCGICSLPNSKDIAITEPEIRQITICSLDVGIAVTFTLKTQKQYQCIAALDDKYVVGCCDIGSPSIDFIDSNGTILRTLESNSSGNKLFRNPASVTCLSSDKILISDPGSCALICADTNGNIKFKLDAKGRPSAVSADSEGRMYMAHYDSNFVYRVAPSGLVEEVVVDQRYGLKHPLAMCLSNNILALTEETPSDRILIVKVDNMLEKQASCISLSALSLDTN